jgi:hypothetical protein
MAPVLKTGIPGRVSGVRIPPSPPFSLGCRETGLHFPEHRPTTPQFCDSRFGTGPEKMPADGPQPRFVAIFSGGRKGSPVSTSPFGECNAITNRANRDCDLTLPWGSLDGCIMGRCWDPKWKF